MQVILKDISEIINYDKNARLHSSEQIDQIANSINEFGFNDPIEIGPDSVIISGHGRLAAAIRLGLTKVPVVVHEHLEGSKREAYVLAANKIAMNSAWDLGILKDRLETLSEDEQLLTGFSKEELLEIFQDDILNIGLTNEDDCPEPPTEPICKLGDLWELGNHRLLCGDSTVATDVERLLNGEHPNTMITDPPYGVNLDMSWRDTAKPDKSKNNKNKVMNDDLADWYDAYVLFPGSVAYVWHASRFTDIVMEGLRKADFEIKQQIIWNKPTLVLGRSNYHWKHEPCWYAIKNGSKHHWKGDRKQTTVWDIASPNQSSNVSNDDKTSHPTQKPVEIYMKSINHHTNQGEYVYDPFGGSGTLVIACEKSNRRALTIELDPVYCDVIVRRWELFTGNKAKRI